MRPVLRYFLAMLLVCTISKAQEDIPVLKKALANASNDSIKIDIYWGLAMSYRQVDQKIARRYIDSVLQKEAYYKKASQREQDYYYLYKANVMTTLANIEIENENWDEAIKIHLECVKLYEKLDYPGLQATSLSNIGAIFVATKKLDDAVAYLKRSAAIQLKIALKNPTYSEYELMVASTFINLGEVYASIPDVDSSIHYYSRALQLGSRSSDEESVGFSYNGLAKGYRIKKELSKALTCNNKAFRIFSKLNNIREMTQSYINFSDIYFDMKDYNRSLQYCDTAERISSMNGFNENRVYIYETKSRIYEQLGDVNKQLTYYQKSTKLRDSLNTVNSMIAIEELKTEYETEKKEQAIEKLKKDNEIKSLQANRLIIVIIAVAVVALLLIWLAIFLQRTIKERKAAYIKLQEKNVYIQKQGELLSEQTKLISKYQSQMNPHFIFNALNSIQGFVVNDQKEKTIEQLQLFSTLMRQTLNNSNDEQISLDTEIKYLRTYIQFEQSRFKDPLTFEVSLPEDAEDILVPPMMIQPFIENCIKHAGLHTMKNAKIDLTISTEEKLLKIVVKDNGSGFDSNKEELFKRSHAVSMIRSRLEILFKAAGMEFVPNYFDMRSKPTIEKGTEVIFYLPLNYKY